MPVYLALPNFLETNGATGIVCPVSWWNLVLTLLTTNIMTMVNAMPMSAQPPPEEGKSP